MTKYHKEIKHQFAAEGNNGGDTFEIFQGSDHADNMVHITVGHCCVYHVDVEIPVEVLTSILVDAIDGGKLINPDVLNWDKKVNKRLLDQMETENDNNQ